jgi:hypothetical protein
VHALAATTTATAATVTAIGVAIEVVYRRPTASFATWIRELAHEMLHIPGRRHRDTLLHRMKRIDRLSQDLNTKTAPITTDVKR